MATSKYSTPICDKHLSGFMPRFCSLPPTKKDRFGELKIIRNSLHGETRVTKVSRTRNQSTFTHSIVVISLPLSGLVEIQTRRKTVCRTTFTPDKYCSFIFIGDLTSSLNKNYLSSLNIEKTNYAENTIFDFTFIFINIWKQHQFKSYTSGSKHHIAGVLIYSGMAKMTLPSTANVRSMSEIKETAPLILSLSLPHSFFEGVF